MLKYAAFLPLLPSGLGALWRAGVLFYRNSTGRKRTLTLGRHGAITPEQARRLVKERLAEVTRGADPAGGGVRGRWMAGASAGLALDLLQRDAVTPRQFLARR